MSKLHITKDNKEHTVVRLLSNNTLECLTCRIAKAKLELLESAIEKDKEGRLTLKPRIIFKEYKKLKEGGQDG